MTDKANEDGLHVVRLKAAPGVTLRQLVENASRFAEAKFAATGTISPMWHADTGAEWLIVASTLADKDSAAAAVRRLFEAEGVRRYLFVDEAWCLERRRGEIGAAEMRAIQLFGLRNHPDRREVVMFSAEDGEQKILARRYILRPEHGPATLSPLQVEDTSADRQEGRLVNMLPQKGGAR